MVYDPDDPEHKIFRTNRELVGGSLFDGIDMNGPAPQPAPIPTARVEGTTAREMAVGANATQIEKLIPVAQALVRGKPKGITVTDLRLRAIELRLLTGKEVGRELSYLGGVMKRAGLRATDEYRRSELRSTHGIPQRVWVEP